MLLHIVRCLDSIKECEEALKNSQLKYLSSCRVAALVSCQAARLGLEQNYWWQTKALKLCSFALKRLLGQVKEGNEGSKVSASLLKTSKAARRCINNLLKEMDNN